MPSAEIFGSHEGWRAWIPRPVRRERQVTHARPVVGHQDRSERRTGQLLVQRGGLVLRLAEEVGAENWGRIPENIPPGGGVSEGP